MENRKNTYRIPEGMREKIFAEASDIKYRGSANIHPSVLMDPSCRILGDVTIGEDVSIFHGATIRAENDTVTIGAESNIQELVCIHASEGQPVVIGEHTTIGHCAIVHACKIGDNSVVGMNAVVLNGAVIGNNCVIGAGAMVKEGMIVPDGHMALGVPAKVVKQMTQDQIDNVCCSLAEINLMEAARMEKEGALLHPTPELLKQVGCL